MIYRPSFRGMWASNSMPNVAPVSNVLFFGDSNTSLGAANMFQTGAYWGWFRYMAGSAFNTVPNVSASRPYFGAGGLKTAELVDYVDEAVAADGELCFIMIATNDALALGDMTVAANVLRTQICAPIKASGKMPVVIATPPIPQGATSGGNDNTTWQMSDKVVEFRALAAAHAAADGYRFYNPMAVVETGTPGRANPAMMNTDSDVHFSPYGAKVMATELVSLTGGRYIFDQVDPLENTTFITPNADMSALSGSNPTGYFYFPGGSITPAIVDDSEGRWWRLTIAASTAVNVWHPGAATGFASGQTLDAITRLRVQSGEGLLGGFALSSVLSTRLSTDLFSSASRQAKLLPEDGIKLFRTPTYTIGAESNAIPQLDFTTGASGLTIDLQKITVRKY